jgi:lipid-A-disaccharide synthase
LSAVGVEAPARRGFGLVAGEASGDNLGAALVGELARRAPGSRFFGIGGPRMAAAGCETWRSSDELAVMGLAEILRHLPRLIAVRRDLLRRLLAARPDAYVGIDAPEFNLGVAARLKAAGIPTVQYVSPQVWAWRQGRVSSIGRSVDLVLCLLPFEPSFYAEHGVHAVFVGHPLADQIPPVSDARGARSRLGLPAGATVLGVLPGSRSSEVARLGDPFAATVAWLARARPGLVFVGAMANARARAVFAGALARNAPNVDVHLVDGRAQEVMAASDAVLLASGTATLECALVKRPMVVCYRMAPLTSWLLRRFRLVKTQHFAQPNLLAERALVPEFFQEQVRPDVLGPAVLGQLDRADRAELEAAFGAIHERLRRNASARAADAVLEMLASRETAA